MTWTVSKVLLAVLGFAFLQTSWCDATPRARLFGEGISFLAGLEAPVETRVGRSLAQAKASPYSYGGYYGYGYYPTYSYPSYPAYSYPSYSYGYTPVVNYGTRPLSYNYSPAPAPPTSGYVAPVPIPVYGAKLTSSSLSR